LTPVRSARSKRHPTCVLCPGIIPLIESDDTDDEDATAPRCSDQHVEALSFTYPPKDGCQAQAYRARIGQVEASMNSFLTTVDAAFQALANANTPEELIDLADRAEAMRAYAKRARLGMIAQNRCADVRVRAERKLGELLAATPRLHGRPKSVPGENTLPSLSELGISDRKISHRAQRLAKIPQPDFDLWLRQAHQQEREITTRDLLAVCEQRRAAERNRRRDGRSVKPGNPHSPHEGLYVGDCLERLVTQEDASINLILTSPPYADARRSVYGGIPADQYVGWWLERAEQFQRVLTRDGSLVVNIKEGSERGERSTYVIDLILAMRRAGWLWTEEYIWHKRNCAPGKWPNRFRDAWEPLPPFHARSRFRNVSRGRYGASGRLGQDQIEQSLRGRLHQRSVRLR
jgi:DNA methylase